VRRKVKLYVYFGGGKTDVLLRIKIQELGWWYLYNREKNINFLRELIISSGNLVVVYTHDYLLY